MGHTHGKEWNDDAIKKNIVEIIEETNLDHFPTHSEMVSFFKNKKLCFVLSLGQIFVLFMVQIKKTSYLADYLYLYRY